MECDAVGRAVAKRWYIVDVVLFGGFALAYVGFFAAISLMDYLGGLRGGSKSFGSFVFCGIVVGPRDMPEPPFDPSREQRRPLAAGAYVWCDGE